jgi:hypothetical protein
MSNIVEPHREKYWWEHYPLHKWWCNDYCPIVPRFHYYKEEKWNPSHFGFHWLLLRVWKLNSFSFEVDAEISFRCLQVGAILPYTRIVFGITDFGYSNHLLNRIDDFLRIKCKAEKELKIEEEHQE